MVGSNPSFSLILINRWRMPLNTTYNMPSFFAGQYTPLGTNVFFPTKKLPLAGLSSLLIKHNITIFILVPSVRTLQISMTLSSSRPPPLLLLLHRRISLLTEGSGKIGTRSVWLLVVSSKAHRISFLLTR